MIDFLPRLLVAILILFVGAFLAEIAGKAAQATSASMGVEFHRGLGKAARALVLITAIIVAALALAFGLGGRDIARNVLAGNYARDVYQTHLLAGVRQHRALDERAASPCKGPIDRKCCAGRRRTPSAGKLVRAKQSKLAGALR